MTTANRRRKKMSLVASHSPRAFSTSFGCSLARFTIGPRSTRYPSSMTRVISRDVPMSMIRTQFQKTGLRAAAAGLCCLAASGLASQSSYAKDPHTRGGHHGRHKQPWVSLGPLFFETHTHEEEEEEST